MKKVVLISMVFCAHQTALAMIDNAHFWRATRFFGEPRYEESWLSSVDITIGGGTTTSSRNTCGQKTALLNLYGPFNFQKLGEGVPGKDPNNPLDSILINLAAQPSYGNFGRMIYNGRFSIVETNIMYTQNMLGGFFAQLQMPIRWMKLSNICRCDLTPLGPDTPNQHNVWWQAFLANFDAILNRYRLNICPYSQTHLGDTALLVGWAKNHEETEVLDFIDITLQSGVLAPTGHIQNNSNPFDFSTGYGGHWGVPLVLDAACGLYEWLNVGASLSALIFFDTNRTMRIKTNSQQNGFVKLASSRAHIERSPLWLVGAYAKADHVARGLSLMMAYSFALQERTYISPCNVSVFNDTIANSDSTLSGFKMHTLNFALEYDFTQQDSRYGPRIGLTYDLQLGGQQIFRTNMAGGLFGIDISWHL